MNPFGGKNPHGLYVPMSSDEQEVLERLVLSNDIVVHLTSHRCDPMSPTRIQFGDHRICVYFTVPAGTFQKEVPVPFLDLELRTGAGLLLFSKQMNVGNVCMPQDIGLDLAWDISIRYMDPDLVRILKPGAFGLTSLRQDRDTKDMTITGNFQRISTTDRKLLDLLEEGERRLRMTTLPKPRR